MQDRLTQYEQALLEFLTMTPEQREAFFKTFHIGLSQKQRDEIKAYTLANTNVKPTPIESVAKLKTTYPVENYKPDNQAYKDIYLIESGADEGHLYWFNTNTMLWTKSIQYEDSNALENKINKTMLNWGFMPETITDKKTFYHEVSKVFVNTPDQTIYMYGDQTELKTFFDIWGKPKGLTATHAIISIRPISNVSSRVSFIIYLTSSNDNKGDIYLLSSSGFSGTYLGDTGWINLKSPEIETLKGIYKVLATDGQGDQIGLDYSVLPQPNTFALRQADGTLSVGTPKEDNDAVNLAYLRSIGVGMDATDLLTMFDNAGDGLIIDLSEDGQHLHIHLDGVDVEKELLVKIYGRNKQSVTLDGIEVNGNDQRDGLRGLRLWLKFPYNGNQLVMHQDIRFPSKQFRNGFQWYITNVIPNPQAFGDKIIVQYDWDTNELKLNSTGGSISADIQLIDVKGIA